DNEENWHRTIEIGYQKMQTGRAIRCIFCGSARTAKGCRFYPSRCMPFRNIYFYFRFGCLLSNSKEVSVLSFMTIRALNLLPELLFMSLIRLVFPLVTRFSISTRLNGTPHTIRN